MFDSEVNLAELFISHNQVVVSLDDSAALVEFCLGKVNLKFF